MTYKQGEVVTISKGSIRGKATRSAFEKVWKDRGWKLVEPKAKSDTSVAGAAGDTGKEVSTNTDKKEGAK